MTIKQVDYDIKLDVQDVIVLGLDNAPDPTVTHTFATSAKLTPTSSPAISRAYSDQLTLSAGALTIDLTNLDIDYAKSNETFDGLKVQGVKIRALATNSDPLLFVKGASDPYELFGAAADGQVELGPGAVFAMIFNEHLADVSATVKNIDVTSADADAKFDIILIAG